MAKKIITTIYIEEKLLKKAKEIGLNISKTSENALKEAINRLECSNLSNNCENKMIGGSDFVVPRVRFELTTIRSSASPL